MIFKTMCAVMLAIALSMGLYALNLALESTYSFDALTCDTPVSCTDLYITCDGEYRCQDEECSTAACHGAPDDGPRHGAGFVWLAGYLLVPLYAWFLARISIKERM